MDREYLLRRRDEELARAREATSEVAKQGYEALARAFEDGAERVQQPVVVVRMRPGELPAT